MGKKSNNRQIAEEVIRFLDQHMLDPSPANYAFAFLYITGANGVLRGLVEKITDGGVRLSQDEVDELMSSGADTGGMLPDSGSAPMDALQAQLRHQALAFTELTSSALMDTSAFNRNLAEGMEQLASGFDLANVIGAMRAKTAEVERRLVETRRETEKLRVELNAARNDATRDALTNLPNRRWMEGEIRDALASGAVVCVAFCDIDHFKSINDRYGHAVGDRVLKAVSEVLEHALTPNPVARFGGEEFVALFVGISEREAYESIERARIAASRKCYKVRETDEPLGQITFSAGIACAAGDAEHVLREADDALYDAKNGGRNRTVCRSLRVDELG